MSNSSLVSYTKLSPNCSKPRNKPISKITIHHMAGNLTVEKCGEVFAPTSRKASSNYGIGSDGRIGLDVEEANRSWCSGSAENDNMAVTIEVANIKGAPNWEVSANAYDALIDLCVDICQRNGIEKLNYTGDKNGNLTMHSFFQATACPGPYLKSKFPAIADEVNRRLEENIAPRPLPPVEVERPYYTVDYSKYPILKKGSKGEYVTMLQTRLVQLGYNPKGIDGIFGPGCDAAVRQFQRGYRLEVDGCVGPKTWAMLYK